MQYFDSVDLAELASDVGAERRVEAREKDPVPLRRESPRLFHRQQRLTGTSATQHTDALVAVELLKDRVLRFGRSGDRD